ncbi:YihY/virulence factor BrkB family protein [Methylobacillus gramineus]|uniref:YihY/virulence factor BrkB family protein n=1 Tax=Methylobacillus gramineus TaxID=755169 RepID=UPI001CFF56F6|nr:YihY/virulence factor BrkB family protein [Methylobacillus gramineus]MCB5184042.1 YihY/virulence factor BrkB family protein [Methylobacillus gramineus]
MISKLLNVLIYQASHRVKCLRQLLVQSVLSWFSHRATSKGAALAFYTMFSLTPILILVIAIAGYFLGERAAHGEIVAQISDLVGESGAQVIQNMLAKSSNPKSGIIATLIASSLLFIGATTVFAELKASLDEIWETTKLKAQGSKQAIGALLKTRLLAFSIIISLAFLLLTSLLVNAGLALVEEYATQFAGRFITAIGIFKHISALVSFGVITSMFAVIYKMLPDVKLPWSDVWAGAAFTAILFSLGKYIIGIYLGNSAVASSFGAAGSLIALLLWVYYSAQIFFFGAEITRQYALTFGSLRDIPTDQIPRK